MNKAKLLKRIESLEAMVESLVKQNKTLDSDITNVRKLVFSRNNDCGCRLPEIKKATAIGNNNGLYRK